MRGVAVALVVVLHGGAAMWPGGRTWLAQGGALGVHVFFVLSGFLITSLLLAEHERSGAIDLAAFASRRTRRLVPVLVALVGVLALGSFGPEIQARHVGTTAFHVLSFTSNWWYSGHPLPLGDWLVGEGTLIGYALHTWSVALEVQFYLVWAISLWAATRAGWSHRRLFVVTAAVVLGLAVARALAYATGWSAHELYLMTWSRLDAPLVGSLAGIAWSAGWLRRRPSWLVPVGAAGLVAVLYFALATQWDLDALPLGLYTGLAVATAATILAVVSSPTSWLARGLAWRPLVGLGLVSYSLYVWHYPIFIVLLRRYRGTGGGPVLFAVGVALAVLVAWVSYRFVERPFRRRRAVAPVSEPDVRLDLAPEPS